RFTLDKSGTFRVLFHSVDEEENANPSAYEMTVDIDGAPTVELTQPDQQNIELPANGTLKAEGYATDDFGVKSMALHFKVLEGQNKAALAPKAYRPGKSFVLVDGSYPQKLDYKDFVALDTLTTDKGVPFPLTKGMVLEEWLEARDNSDYPNKDGNVGQSKPRRLTILDPEKNDQKIKQDRKEAQKEQQQHEGQQDKDIDKRNQDKLNPQNNDAR